MKRKRYTEQRILLAAEKEFLEKGFHKAKTILIAKEAGVTPLELHSYFLKKEDLFQVVFLKKLKMISVALNVFYERYPTEIALRKTVEANFDLFQSQPNLAKFLYEEILINTKQRSYLFNLLQSRLKDLYEQIEKMLFEKITSGEMKLVEPMELTMNILSINMFTFLLYPDAKLYTGEYISYDIYLAQRKESNVQFILNALRP